MQNLQPDRDTFQNSDSWMVQCLSLATIGALAYMHIAPMVNGIA